MILIRYEQEPTLMEGLYVPAWHECRELQARPLEKALDAVVQEVMSFPRAEIVSATENPVAGLVLVPSEDMHVGPCATVMWAYVKPAARQQGWYRRLFLEAMKQAREWRLPCMMYSHRVSEGVYLNRYKRI